MDVLGYLNQPVPRWWSMVAFIATAIGASTTTYVVMRKKFDEVLDERVRTEVAGTEKFLSSISQKKYTTPMEALENIEDIGDAEEIIEAEKYTTGDDTGDRVEVAKNVWTNARNYEYDPADIEKRTPDKPYIITETEFFETENQTLTITWYVGDEVLADEKDEHIPDIDRVVGEDNLLRFGYGSGDPNILYVRNEKFEVDYEVVKNEGKFTEQVYGFIQHEDRQGPRKFRVYDD